MEKALSPNLRQSDGPKFIDNEEQYINEESNKESKSTSTRHGKDNKLKKDNSISQTT